MLTILLAVVLLLAVIFSDQFKFSVNGQFNPNAILSIVLVGEYLVYIDICKFLVVATNIDTVIGHKYL